MFNNLLQFLNRYFPIEGEDYEALLKKVEVREFNKKTKLIDIGETEQYMNYVFKGLLRIYFFKEKEEVITHIIKEGGIFSSSNSFFSGTPSKYIVETIEPVTILSISKKNLEELFSSGKKWERMGRTLVTNYFIVQEYRLLDNIRFSTKERFVRFMNENPDLLLRVPQKYLASYLNIKPETFSRMKQLMKDSSYSIS